MSRKRLRQKEDEEIDVSPRIETRRGFWKELGPPSREMERGVRYLQRFHQPPKARADISQTVSSLPIELQESIYKFVNVDDQIDEIVRLIFDFMSKLYILQHIMGYGLSIQMPEFVYIFLRHLRLQMERHIDRETIIEYVRSNINILHATYDYAMKNLKIEYELMKSKYESEKRPIYSSVKYQDLQKLKKVAEDFTDVYLSLRRALGSFRTH